MYIEKEVCPAALSPFSPPPFFGRFLQILKARMPEYVSVRIVIDPATGRLHFALKHVSVFQLPKLVKICKKGGGRKKEERAGRYHPIRSLVAVSALNETGVKITSVCTMRE